MIDGTVARVHQHAANSRKATRIAVWAERIRSARGGPTTKVHVLVDARGLPLEMILTPGQAADCPAAEGLLARWRETTILLAD
jgi:transposase